MDQVTLDVQDRGDAVAHTEDPLSRSPHGEFAGAGVHAGDGPARFHVAADDASKSHAQAHDRGSVGERAGDVAETALHFAGHVGTNRGVQDRRVWTARGQNVADPVERSEVDFHLLGGVAGDAGVVGDDDGDRLADVADGVAGQHRSRRGLHSGRRWVAHRALNLWQVGEREGAVDAWVAPGWLEVDAIDPGVRVGRTDHGHVEHAGQRDIFDVVPLPAHQCRVFAAPERGTNHRSIPR